MKLRLSFDTIKRGTAAIMAGGMFAGAVLTAAPAMAESIGPKTLDRRAVIQRAKTWTNNKVEYSQSDYKNGYRTDCSGFISMAWNIPENIVTWNVPLVAKPISKNELKAGDVLLNTKRDRHVVMFEKWADSKHKSYWVLEQTGQNSVEGTIRRKMVYPYRIDGELYKPYRYTGMSRYFKAIKPGQRQPVKGYKLLEKPVVKVQPKAEPRKLESTKPVQPTNPVAPKAPAHAPAPKNTAPMTPGFLSTVATLLGIR